MKGARILVLEDDVNLSDIVDEYLSENGYLVDLAYDAKECIDLTYENRYDVLLLDVKVPYQNGFDLLKELRQAGITTPAIFTTSLNTIDDITEAYNAGCDDYLRKPFELKELNFRIQTLLRRSFGNGHENRVPLCNDLLYDIEHGCLIQRGKTVVIPKKEGKILRLLVKYHGKAVELPLIFEEAWDEEEPSELSLRTYIKNLRKIVGKDLIQNIRGVGYMLVKN